MAFESAIEFNFDMIEFDTQLTKDNILIIYHDTFINDVLISNHLWNELHFFDLDIVTLQDFFLKFDTKNSPLKFWTDILLIVFKKNAKFLRIPVIPCHG